MGEGKAKSREASTLQLLTWFNSVNNTFFSSSALCTACIQRLSMSLWSTQTVLSIAWGINPSAVYIISKTIPSHTLYPAHLTVASWSSLHSQSLSCHSTSPLSRSRRRRSWRRLTWEQRVYMLHAYRLREHRMMNLHTSDISLYAWSISSSFTAWKQVHVTLHNLHVVYMNN